MEKELIGGLVFEDSYDYLDFYRVKNDSGYDIYYIRRYSTFMVPKKDKNNISDFYKNKVTCQSACEIDDKRYSEVGFDHDIFKDIKETSKKYFKKDDSEKYTRVDIEMYTSDYLFCDSITLWVYGDCVAYEGYDEKKEKITERLVTEENETYVRELIDYCKKELTPEEDY